jgi:hypothetical protein
VIELAKSKPNSQTSLARYKYPPISLQNLVKPVSISAKWIRAFVATDLQTLAVTLPDGAMLESTFLFLRIVTITVSWHTSPEDRFV